MALQPASVACEVVEVEHVHVLDHPLGTLTIRVVPGAVATTFLGPNVDHLSGEVERVRQERSNEERDAHHTTLDVVVVEVVVHPKEEELVLHEGVESAIGCPEHVLTGPNGETSLEEIRNSFFKWNP